MMPTELLGVRMAGETTIRDADTCKTRFQNRTRVRGAFWPSGSTSDFDARRGRIIANEIEVAGQYGRIIRHHSTY